MALSEGPLFSCSLPPISYPASAGLVGNLAVGCYCGVVLSSSLPSLHDVNWPLLLNFTMPSLAQSIWVHDTLLALAYHSRLHPSLGIWPWSICAHWHQAHSMIKRPQLKLTQMNRKLRLSPSCVSNCRNLKWRNCPAFAAQNSNLAMNWCHLNNCSTSGGQQRKMK